MWALAISSSSHPIAHANALYIDTRRRLQDLEVAGSSDELLDLMQAQAWILIAVYEFIRVDFRRGWMRSVVLPITQPSTIFNTHASLGGALRVNTSRACSRLACR